MNLESGGPSFDDAVRTHAGDLFRYAYWLARNRQQAEDIVQEALIRGWRAFAQIKDRAAVKSWLFSIVKNEFHRASAQDARHGGVDAADIDVIDDRSSPFGESTAYHVILMVPQDKVTLLVMPDTSIPSRTRATHDGMYASVVPLRKGSVGIVGASAAVVDSVAGALKA